MTKEIVDYVFCSNCGKQVSNKVGHELTVRAWVECTDCLESFPEDISKSEIAARVGVRHTPVHELMKQLEALPHSDLAGLVFYLVGYMSVQKQEIWRKFCEGIQGSPCFTEGENGDAEDAKNI